MFIKNLSPEALKVIETSAIYKDKHEKLKDEVLDKSKTTGEFPQVLDEEIKKLTEKDNSSLKSR